MREKKVMHLNDTERPIASKGTFCQTWELKHLISSSQVPEFQSVSGVPFQTGWTGPKKYHSHLLSRVLLEAHRNAVYFLTVTTSPCQSQLHTNSGHFEATNCSHLLPDVAPSLSPSQTSAEEELLEICASDLLLESPARKRLRLLPPSRKIHMEVQRKKASHLPEESVRSPVPLEYNRLVDTMKMTTPADLREAESLYRSRFSPRLKGHSCCCRRESPIQPLGKRPSPSGDTESSTCLQSVKISHRQFQHSNQESSTARSCPAMTAKECTDSSHNCCLPPKKRYTYGCL